MAGRLIALDKSWEEAPAPPPPAATRLQALDASQWQEVPPGPAPDAEGPSALEAGLRGLKQGATAGFGDEISGVLGSAFTDKTYAQARDEARAADKAARDAHPWVFGAGELGGGLATSLIPGGAIVKGGQAAIEGGGFLANAARVAAPHILRGAGAGILQGIGESEATDVAGVAQDAAKSGLGGAIVGGVLGTVGEKLFKGAPKRADERLIQDITGGRATAAGKKVYQGEGKVLDAAKKYGLDKVENDPASLFDAANSARQQVGQQIGQVYDDADRVFLGVKANEVAAALRATAKKYTNPVDAPIRKEIDTLVNQVKKDWGRGGARARVPLADVNQMVTKLENVGFASANVNPTASAQLERDLAQGVETVLQKRMSEIQQFAGHVKAAPTAGRSPPLAASMSAADGLKRLGDLNKDYQGLRLIGNITKERAAVPPSNRAAGGLRNIMGNLADTGALTASIATANPLPYLATAVGKPLLNAGVKAGDKLLANIANAAATGKTTARLVQQAIEAGVPRGAIAAALTPSGVLGTGEAPAE